MARDIASNKFVDSPLAPATVTCQVRKFVAVFTAVTAGLSLPWGAAVARHAQFAARPMP